MPLADYSGFIASLLQKARQGLGPGLDHCGAIGRSNTGSLLTKGIFTGEERKPGRRTGGSGTVAAGKTQAIGREFINVRRLQVLGFGAVATDITIAEIISHNNNDIGLGCCLGLRGEKQACDQNNHGTNKKRLVFHGTGEGCRRHLTDSRSEFMKKPAGLNFRWVSQPRF